MKKIKVGITGGIGAGKSVVSSIFQKMGFPVFNSDQEAKKLIHESLALKSEIIFSLNTRNNLVWADSDFFNISSNF